MPALNTKRVDFCPERFGDPQPIDCQQRDQRMLGGGAETGRDQAIRERLDVPGLDVGSGSMILT